MFTDGIGGRGRSGFWRGRIVEKNYSEGGGDGGIGWKREVVQDDLIDSEPKESPLDDP